MSDEHRGDLARRRMVVTTDVGAGGCGEAQSHVLAADRDVSASHLVHATISDHVRIGDALQHFLEHCEDMRVELGVARGARAKRGAVVVEIQLRVSRRVVFLRIEAAAAVIHGAVDAEDWRSVSRRRADVRSEGNEGHGRVVLPNVVAEGVGSRRGSEKQVVEFLRSLFRTVYVAQLACSATEVEVCGLSNLLGREVLRATNLALFIHRASVVRVDVSVAIIVDVADEREIVYD